MLWPKLMKLQIIKYFWVLLYVLYIYFLKLLFRYIDLICTCLSMYNMPIKKWWLKNWIQNVQFFIILSSYENWVSQMWFEVQHIYVMIKIKEDISNWIENSDLHNNSTTHGVNTHLHNICCENLW